MFTLESSNSKGAKAVNNTVKRSEDTYVALSVLGVVKFFQHRKMTYHFIQYVDIPCSAKASTARFNSNWRTLSGSTGSKGVCTEKAWVTPPGCSCWATKMYWRKASWYQDILASGGNGGTRPSQYNRWFNRVSFKGSIKRWRCTRKTVVRERRSHIRAAYWHARRIRRQLTILPWTGERRSSNIERRPMHRRRAVTHLVVRLACPKSPEPRLPIPFRDFLY